jgi:hypothetical protein
MELQQARRAALARANTILSAPVLTADDRRAFNEQMELAAEIADFAARLQRHGERWNVRPHHSRRIL